MQPITKTVNGTGIGGPFIMDYMQNPFQVSIGTIATAGFTGVFSVEHCLDFAKVMAPTWDGTTGVTWYQNSAISSATTSLTGNYAYPVAAIRLNVFTASATTFITINISQASNVP